MTSLKTSIKTITYLSDIGCLEIQGASLITFNMVAITLNYLQIRYNEPLYIIMKQICIYIKHGYF